MKHLWLLFLTLMPFDHAKADQAVQFIESYCRHTIGRYAGSPFLLEDWQKNAIVRPIFGLVNEAGFRQVQTAFVEIPRKNGKSEIAAAVTNKLLFADKEPAAEIYSAAKDKNQAGIVYRVVENMVRRNPVLKARALITRSQRNIAVPKTDSFYRVVSADGGAQHGLNPHGVIFDEVHTQRTRQLWDALTMGSDTRQQPLILAITTSGVPDEAPLWVDLHDYARAVRTGEIIDPTFLSVFYGAEPGDDFDDPRVWKKANPALGSFLSMEKFQAAWARARKIPSEWTEFLRYRLNVAVQEADRWLPVEIFDQCKEDEFDETALYGQVCFAGIDLSTRRDVTALSLLFPQADGSIRALWRFWLPEENVLPRFRAYAKAGYITTTPGNAIDYGYIREECAELAQKYRIKSVSFDTWNATHLAQELATEGLPMVETRFGVRTMNAPSKEFESLYVEKRFRHGGNPVMRYMIECVSIRADNSGNIIPRKPNRLKSEKRVDGVVATIMAIDGLTRELGQSKTKSVFELMDVA